MVQLISVSVYRLIIYNGRFLSGLEIPHFSMEQFQVAYSLTHTEERLTGCPDPGLEQ